MRPKTIVPPVVYKSRKKQPYTSSSTSTRADATDGGRTDVLYFIIFHVLMS